MRKQVKQTGLLLMVMAAGILAAAGSVKAEEGGGRAGRIRSKGIINYADGRVVIDSGDLIRLAEEIDTLEDTYKTAVLKALNGIGTYLREDGSVTHTAPGTQPALPAFGMLTTAVTGSQSFATASADLSGDSYYKAHDGGLITGSSGQDTSGAQAIELTAALPEQLSAGTVAYIDGNLILGNGADNKAYYNLGYTEGYAQKIEGLEIEYHYHVHQGEVGLDTIPDGYIYYSETDPGGCFRAAGHVHNKTAACPSHTERCDGKINFVGANSTTKTWCPDYPGASSGSYQTLPASQSEPCPKCGHSEKRDGDVYGPYDCGQARNVWDCGSPNNTWQLGCGRTTATIDSATIVYP